VLSARKSQLGVSLIELMVAVVIASILIAMAAPNFRDWIQNSQVRNAAESIVSGLQLARSEAVHLNKQVRFNMNSAAGMADWEVCTSVVGAPAASPCPAANILQQRSGADGSVNARVGVYKINDGQAQANFAQVIAAGNEMVTHVTFNGLGRTVNDGPDNTARIDVTNAVAPGARRMVIVIDNPGGNVRMCDPALTVSNPTDPKAC
jgi:type IV fimbrial biogenesis protein FimT